MRDARPKPGSTMTEFSFFIMKSASFPRRNEACLSVCKRLLGGELAAVAVYGRIIRKYEGEPAAAVLRQVRDEHERAAELLRGHIREMGGGPVIESGRWGAWSETEESLAYVFGEAAIFRELQKNEAHWCAQHRDALKDEALSPACAALIRFELLPRAEGNIDSLQSLSSLTPAECGGERFPFVPEWL